MTVSREDFNRERMDYDSIYRIYIATVIYFFQILGLTLFILFLQFVLLILIFNVKPRIEIDESWDQSCVTIDHCHKNSK